MFRAQEEWEAIVSELKAEIERLQWATDQREKVFLSLLLQSHAAVRGITEITEAIDFNAVPVEVSALRAERDQLRLQVEELTRRAEFAERAKFGTPCRCESWITACGLAEERAERAERELAGMRWVSVGDRLPETEELVHVWRTDRPFHLDTGWCYFAEDGSRYWGAEVTHWMPLMSMPSPPGVPNDSE